VRKKAAHYVNAMAVCLTKWDPICKLPGRLFITWRRPNIPTAGIQRLCAKPQED
jgi:hypothetical protein